MSRRVLSSMVVLVGFLTLGPAFVAVGQTGEVSNWAAPGSWNVPRRAGARVQAIESDIGNPLPFVPVTPCRIVDTRNAAGPYGGPSIAPGSPRSFALESGPCTGIPSTVAAYSLNITATNTTGTGFVKVYPQGGSSPTVSTLNFTAGETVANAAVVAAGTGGGVTVAAAARTDVLIDINGYYISTLNSSEQLLVTANSGSGAIRGVNSSGDGVQGETASGASSGVYGKNTGGGKGAFGVSTSGNGVEGQSTSGAGVAGNSSSGSGVYGHTAGTSGASGAAGVWGDTHDFFGVWGTSIGGDGVHGQSSTASGVYGVSNGAGVWGDSTGFDGVHGHTTVGTASGVAGFNDSSGAGTFGSSAIGDGVFGTGPANGVHGASTLGSGVYGHSQAADGVHGDTPDNNHSGVAGINTAHGYGVFGASQTGIGVFGVSVAGDGGVLGNSIGVLGIGGASTTGNGGPGVKGVGGSSSGDYPSIGVWGVAGASSGLAVYFQGGLGGTGTKNFIEPHPTDPTKEIRYASLEGREVGTYFRGTGHISAGSATITVPEDFKMVTDDAGLTVQVTPIGSLATLACISKSLDEIVIQGSADVDFDFTVNGVRKAFKDYEPVVANTEFVPTSAADPLFTRGLPEESLRRLKANGILKDDGSINEETAHRLGWDQRPGWNQPLPAPIAAINK